MTIKTFTNNMKRFLTSTYCGCIICAGIGGELMGFVMFANPDEIMKDFHSMLPLVNYINELLGYRVMGLILMLVFFGASVMLAQDKLAQEKIEAEPQSEAQSNP